MKTSSTLLEWPLRTLLQTKDLRFLYQKQKMLKSSKKKKKKIQCHYLNSSYGVFLSLPEVTLSFQTRKQDFVPPIHVMSMMTLPVNNTHKNSGASNRTYAVQPWPALCGCALAVVRSWVQPLIPPCVVANQLEYKTTLCTILLIATGHYDPSICR